MRNTDEGYSSSNWAGPYSESQPRNHSARSVLLDDETEEHKVKDNQFIEERWELSSPEVKPGTFRCSPDESPESDAAASSSPTEVFPDDELSQEGNLNVSSLTNIRSVRSRHILEERHKKMVEHLHVLSSSLAAWFYSRKWRQTSLWKRRARQRIQATIPPPRMPTDRRRSSIGGTRFVPSADHCGNTHGYKYGSSQQRSLKPGTAVTNLEGPVSSRSLSYLTDIPEQAPSQSKQRKHPILSALRAWPQNPSDQLERKQEEDSTAFLFADYHAPISLRPPPHLPPLTLTRQHSSVPTALHQLDELSMGQQAGQGGNHRHISQSSQTSTTSERRRFSVPTVQLQFEET